MKYFVLLLAFVFLFTSRLASADDQPSKAEQCAQYGAYQDEEGNWQTCSEDHMPSDDT